MEGVLTLVDGPISWLDCALFRAIHPITMPGPTMLSIAECFAVGPLLVALLAIALIWIVTRVALWLWKPVSQWHLPWP